mmetsp:Transcript_6452/g.11062  ORF Transcript_6452/g.11062 Transcript_6452/m.11062 type:complete len:208 (-) Transcript_6452:388-1011(-)
MTMHEDTGEESVDRIFYSQRFFVLRMWSSKLFEFIEFCTMRGSHNKTGSSTLKSALAASKESIDKISNSNAYKLARALRHETTNHYSLRAAKKNVKHIDPTANASLYLHKMQGNGHYALGDELVFTGRLNRFMIDQKLEHPREIIESWVDWNISATSLAHSIHAKLYSDLLISKMPDKRKRKRMHWLPWSSIGFPSGPFLPAIFRRE